MVVIILQEGKDHRYSVIQSEDGKEEKIDSCDAIAAESIALEAHEMGLKVKWEYLEDVFASR